MAKRFWPVLAVALASFALAACETTLKADNFGTSLPAPDAAYNAQVEEYRISPNDKISATVFPRKEFSFTGVRVDAVGEIVAPEIGSLTVKGLTARELAAELKQRLGKCCLQDPQVMVQVDETTSQKVWIQGAVMAPDVYNLNSRTTLLQAIGMAKGPDRTTANLRRVAIVRTIEGKRMGALFDVVAIRDGKAEDPLVYGGDQIIVDSSQVKSVWKNAVSAIPFFGVFTAL